MDTSFENFAALRPYTGENADDIFEIGLPAIPYVDDIWFAEVSVGRIFQPQDWTAEGVNQMTVAERIFDLPSPSTLRVAVRVIRLYPVDGFQPLG